jgi:hypothetical protein
MVLALRVALAKRMRIEGTSRTRSVKVMAGAPTTAGASGAATVVSASSVKSVPGPGSSGAVILAGEHEVSRGSVLALSVGPNTPEGFLGMVDGVTHKAGETVVETSPTTLEAAVPEGSFELANATRVVNAREASVRKSSSPGARAASDDDSGAFSEDLAKAITCEGGAQFSATGTVGLSATPKLSISWSLFHGVSASFIETVTANASLSGEVSAAGDCTFSKTGLLAHPADLGTFVGDVFGIPVVVSLQGQIYLDGKAEAQGSVSAGISGQVSASGGIAYSHGKISLISPTTSLHYGPTGPTVQASASIGAHVTPELQVLLYGVGGPVFDATTGLDFNANVQNSPWWTLTAPLDVTASLQAPILNLSTPELTLYSHTFTIAQASGPFGPLTPPTPTPIPPVETPVTTTPASGPTLIYERQTALPPEEESFEFIGDLSFNEWAEATGQPAEVDETLPASITPYKCVMLLANQSLEATQEAELAAYLHQGGTILAVGEHGGGAYETANETLSRFASSLGVGLNIRDGDDDYGPNVTYDIYPTPLTENVFSLGDNWVSVVEVSGSAEPLAGTADGEGILIGAQTVGSGTFIMSGDSNLFTDQNYGAYQEDDNGQLVRNICP